MEKRNGIAVLGGDARQTYMANVLAEKGFSVWTWAVWNGEGRFLPTVCRRWEDAVREANAVILPLPATADGKTVRLTEPNREAPAFAEMLPLLSGKILLGGMFPEEWIRLGERAGVSVTDYGLDGELLIKNASVTAEGALMLAMQALPVTVDGTAFAVMGYGRIGKLLADRLNALGGRVTVYARSREARAKAVIDHHTAKGFRPSSCGSIPEEFAPDCRVIFNTVPARILPAEALCRIPSGCMLAELASAPGGFDPIDAKRSGITVLGGGSLPGRYAPESAGRILAEAVLSLSGADKTSGMR